MNNLSVRPNDRVLVRELPWRVLRVQGLSDATSVIELESVDSPIHEQLSVVVPPEEINVLPSEALQFDVTALDPFTPWSRAHQILAETLVVKAGLISAAKYGRLTLEAYQLKPILRMLNKPRPSLLIADDVGLGKTIEAGLALLELLARGQAHRVLIVTPPGLLTQWKEELHDKFGLEFVVIDDASGLAKVQGELPAGVNPWDVLPRVLTSVDFLKKETVYSRALRKRWDLVIVDEAHGLAEAGTSENPYRTQRTRLGMALRDNTRGLVLLTATPHNGYPHSFRSLLELVEPTLATFHGDEASRSRRIQAAMIRRMKAQIVRRKPDGTQEPVFPLRHVQAIPVTLTAQEQELLHKVGRYCSQTSHSAEGTEDADLVTFAMQIVRKRALSSRAALAQTIEHRLDALRQQELEVKPTRTEIRELQLDLPLSEAGADRVARQIVRTAIPKEERRRKAETTALNSIRRLLRNLPARDPKVHALHSELRDIFEKHPKDKVIVFTEYLDTLAAIRAALEGARDLGGKVVVMRGGMSTRQRIRVQEEFEQPETRVLLATDAASEGLNLQRRCYRVIHFELPWNPNRLEQRNGRVDRYGQTRRPEIRYLYYPESPEDDVLHRLVEKIERMQSDRVSTPDILGVLRGAGELDRGLVELDPTAKDIEARKTSLVKMFEDRTADFVKNVLPLISVESAETDQGADLAESLLDDGGRLEALVSDVLGAGAVQQTREDGILRIEVPLAYRGVGVLPIYERATFNRSIAVQHRAADVEFITPIHPLVQALAAEARRRLLQVYVGQRGLPPRRMAARRIPKGETPAIVFTFLGTITGEAGLLEERLVTVQLTPDSQILGSSDEVLRHVLDAKRVPGEVSPGTLQQLFGKHFDQMVAQAVQIANKGLVERAASLRASRHEQAAQLRKALEMDLADRLLELEEEERYAKGLVDVDSGQFQLFASETARATGFQSRRSAAQAYAEKRHAEIRGFEQVTEPSSPRLLGALFVVPEGVV